MIKTLFLKSIILALNFIVPGTGLAILGYWRLALLTLLTLTVPLILLCFTRAIFNPSVVLYLLIFTALVYIASTGACCYLRKNTQNIRRKHNLLCGLFIIVGLLGLSVGFSVKHLWLGVNIYFVPSMSMYPTLRPGQFILIDTWLYRNETPIIDDVVIFKQGTNKNRWLVKRIANWPNGRLCNNSLFYLLGDNSAVSHDSRRFGGVVADDIIGKVNIVLLGINPQQHVDERVWLQAVR